MTKRIREQNRDRLKEMMAAHNLTRDDVAAMLDKSVFTIDAWLKPETSASSNPIPSWVFELLPLKAASRDRRSA